MLAEDIPNLFPHTRRALQEDGLLVTGRHLKRCAQEDIALDSSSLLGDLI